MNTKDGNHPDLIRSLQIGKSWLPEQAGSGLDRMFYGLAHSLPGAGVDVRGLVAGSDRVAQESQGIVSAFASDKASLVSRWIGSRSAISTLVKSGQFDIAAIHFAVYAFPGRKVLRKMPRVIHFHGPWALESQVEGKSGLNVRAKLAVEQAVYRGAERFIVLSEAFASVLSENYGVSNDHIRIVPGGVDADRFDTGGSATAARERLRWPTDRPIVLSVRRLARRMGLENLIQAAALVKSRVPDVLFLMAGKGPIEQELQGQIESMGLEETVRLVGFVSDEDLPYAYRASTVSIAPTVSLEGFGLITIESLASGTPVLVTPIGGLPEVVTNLDSNLILDGPSPDQIADRLSSVLTGSILLPDSAACQQYARDHFDWSAIASQTRAVYEEALL